MVVKEIVPLAAIAKVATLLQASTNTGVVVVEPWQRDTSGNDDNDDVMVTVTIPAGKTCSSSKQSWVQPNV